MRITYNYEASDILRNYKLTARNKDKHVERLSTGYQINRAADNAAGLCISSKMRAQVKGLKQASINAQDGMALLDTADGGMNEIHAMLQRIRELSVQSSNDTNTEEERNSLNEEVGDLKNEIDRIATQTEFNTRKLLNGQVAGSKLNKSTLRKEQDDYGSTLNFRFRMDACKDGVLFSIDGLDFQFSDNATEPEQIQIGSTLEETADNIVATAYNPIFEKYDDMGYFADIMCTNVGGKTYDLDLLVFGYPDELSFAYKDPSESGLNLQVGANHGQLGDLEIGDVQTDALGIADLNVTDFEQAQDAIVKTDAAIEKVSKERTKIGAVRNRLEHTFHYLDTAAENLEETESKIRDAKIEKEAVEYAKDKILAQASEMLLSHANHNPEKVLDLLT